MTPDITEDPLLSPTRVSELFDVTPRTVRLWIRDGYMEATKLRTGHIRIRQSEVNRFAQEKYGENADG